MQIHSIASCRVSTLEQSTDGNSLTRQGGNVQNTAEILNAPILKTWSGDWSSKAGTNIKRKDLAEMMEFCKKHRSVKYLIVDEVDRFMRSIDELYYFEVEFRKLCVTVYYASQPELNSKDSMSKFNKLFKVFQAESSNDERIAKTTNGLKDRVRLGYYPFPVPQGYRKTLTPGLFEPDGLRFDLLKTAFYKVLEGDKPVEVLSWLRLNGYEQPNGKQLYLCRFMKILRCPYYGGAIRIEGWKFTNERALHQPMLSLDDFEKVQRILDGKKFKVARKNHNPEYPLSKLMECTVCEGKLTGFLQNNGKGRTYNRYKCRGCGKMYSRSDVHDALSEVLASVRFDEAHKALLIEALREAWSKEEADNISRTKMLETRVDVLKQKKSKLLIALAENPDLAESYKEMIRSVEAEVFQVESEAVNVNASSLDKDWKEFLEFSLGFIEGKKESWWELNLEEMEKCKSLLFPAGFSINYEKIVYTPEVSPLFRLEGTKKSPLGAQNFDMVVDREESLHPILLELSRWRRLLMGEYNQYLLSR